MEKVDTKHVTMQMEKACFLNNDWCCFCGHPLQVHNDNINNNTTSLYASPHFPPHLQTTNHYPFQMIAPAFNPSAPGAHSTNYASPCSILPSHQSDIASRSLNKNTMLMSPNFRHQIINTSDQGSAQIHLAHTKILITMSWWLVPLQTTILL